MWALLAAHPIANQHCCWSHPTAQRRPSAATHRQLYLVRPPPPSLPHHRQLRFRRECPPGLKHKLGHQAGCSRERIGPCCCCHNASSRAAAAAADPAAASRLLSEQLSRQRRLQRCYKCSSIRIRLYFGVRQLQAEGGCIGCRRAGCRWRQAREGELNCLLHTLARFGLEPVVGFDEFGLMSWVCRGTNKVMQTTTQPDPTHPPPHPPQLT